MATAKKKIAPKAAKVENEKGVTKMRNGGIQKVLKPYKSGGEITPTTTYDADPTKTNLFTRTLAPTRASIYRKGGKIVEKDTKEVYPSKKAMMKHEKSESKKTKIKEGDIKVTKKGKTITKLKMGGKKC